MILITGGLGFIGSHTCVELLDNDQDIIDKIVDAPIKEHVIISACRSFK